MILLKTIYFAYIISFFISSPSSAEQLRKLIFQKDSMNRVLQLPETGCSAHLDDERSFNFNSIGKDQIEIRFIGYDDSSAILFVECKDASYFYNLIYVRSLDTDEIVAPFLLSKRRNSYIESLNYKNASGLRRQSLRLLDRSYDFLQLNAGAGQNSSGNSKDSNYSLGLSHAGAEWRLAYELQQSRNLDKDYRDLSLNTYFRGLSFSHMHRKAQTSKRFNAATYLYVPFDLNLSLSHFHYENDEEIMTAERIFWGDFKTLSLSGSVRFIHFEHSQDPADSKYELDLYESFDLQLPRRPMQHQKITCIQGERCRLEEWDFHYGLKLGNQDLDFEYGLLPHYLTLKSWLKLSKYHYLNLELTHSFSAKPLRWLKPWVVEDKRRDFSSSLGELHLELNERNFSLYANHLFKGEGRFLQGQIIGGRLRYEDWESNLSLNLSPGRPEGRAVQLDFRYFFEQNTRKFFSKIGSDQLKVKVLSNAKSRPIWGAVVKLMDGQRVLTELQTEEGKDLELSIPRSIAELSIEASKDGIFSREKINLDWLDLSKAFVLVLDDHRQFDVEFLKLKSDPDGSPLYESLVIENYIPELDAAVVGREGALYQGSTLWLPRKGISELKLREDLLPFQYKIIKVEGVQCDTLIKEPGLVKVFVKENY